MADSFLTKSAIVLKLRILLKEKNNLLKHPSFHLGQVLPFIAFMSDGADFDYC